MTEDEMAGWRHHCNEHELGQYMVRDSEVQHAAIHGISKSWTPLGDSSTTTTIQFRACLVGQMVKNPAMWENQVRSLDQEDPLEKGIATQSTIHA